MTVHHATLDASPDQVWAVLADGWLYPLWMVGATAIRHVDPAWPAAGATVEHAAGAWPLTVDDTTRVLSAEPGERLVLRVQRWPLGSADLVLSLSATPAGGTRMTLEEKAVSGLGSLLPDAVRAPVLRLRNTETLTRIGFLSSGRGKRAP